MGQLGDRSVPFLCIRSIHIHMETYAFPVVLDENPLNFESGFHKHEEGCWENRLAVL